MENPQVLEHSNNSTVETIRSSRISYPISPSSVVLQKYAQSLKLVVETPNNPTGYALNLEALLWPKSLPTEHAHTLFVFQMAVDASDLAAPPSQV